MRQKAREYLSAFALLEWGAILLYFHASGRLAAFLHPNFRAMVLVAGILLLLTSVCYVIAGANGHGHEGDHDCGAEHHCCHEDPPSWSFKAVFSFFILLVPFAFAAWISPDGFGATKIRNSEFVENAVALPGAADRARRIAESAEARPVQSAPANAGGGPSKDSTQQMQPSTPDIRGENGKVYNMPLPVKTEAPVANDVVPTGSPTGNAAGSQAAPQEAEGFKPGRDGCYEVSVVDLLFSAEDPEIRQQLSGKSLKVLGQYMPAAGNEPKGSSFRLMRLFMVCCAADARPAKVIVETQMMSKPFHAPAEMAWLNIVGSIIYRQNGDQFIPFFTAREISPAPAPEDPFVY